MTYNEQIEQTPYNYSDVVMLCSYHSEVHSVSPSTQAATWNTDPLRVYLNMKSVTKDIRTTSAQKSCKTLMGNIH